MLIPALAAAARTRLAAGEMAKVVRSWECLKVQYESLRTKAVCMGISGAVRDDSSGLFGC